MDRRDDRIVSGRALLYVGLVAFVLAWILGPAVLRDTIPIWLPFLVALGLELSFLVGALRPGRGRRPDRGPQPADRARYGYPDEGAESEDGEEEPLLEAPRRSPLRGVVAALGILAAVVVLEWLVGSRTGWDALDRETKAAAEHRLSEEASVVAGKPVSVRCDESGEVVGVIRDADGAAVVGGRTAYLTPALCHTLYELAFRGEVTASRTGRALAVLAHEAWHLRGVADEGEAECYAFQSGVELGRRLGLSEGRASQLMRQQLTENALRGAASVEYRVPAECRDGGRLDLLPSDGRFP